MSKERDGDTFYTVSPWGYAMPSGEQPGAYGEACGEGSRLDKQAQCLQDPCRHGYQTGLVRRAVWPRQGRNH